MWDMCVGYVYVSGAGLSSIARFTIIYFRHQWLVHGVAFTSCYVIYVCVAL